MKKLLVNGCVYDGRGQEAVYADILIENDRIAKIGKNLDTSLADYIYDADGKAVVPGFVDMHRHCDKSPFENGRYGDVLLRQGITTVATGNCGISMYPVGEDIEAVRQMQDYYAPVLGNISAYTALNTYNRYMERLSQESLPVNTAALIGMGAIRIAVKGFSKNKFTRKEIIQCKQIIENAMIKGCPGVSIGLMYLPECYETVEELGEILSPVGSYDGIVTVHIRGEGDSLVKSVQEAIEIGKRAGCRLEISHFKACGVKNWNREIFRAIELIEKAKENGQSVDCDFYPYDCGSTTLMSMIPPAFVEGNIPEALNKMKTENGKEMLRKMLSYAYNDWDNYAISLGWDKVVISAASQEKNQRAIGKTIPEIKKIFGYSDEIEAVCELLTSENGTVAIIIRSMDQGDVDTVAALPYSCLISDAIYAETNRPHPRMWGAFPRLIHDYVNERKILTFEEAIKKMTSIPAERLKIKERGRIEEGYFADINVFDPKVFRDKASYTEPTQYAEGLSYCFVNGELVVENDKVLSGKAGKVLYRSN